MAYTALITDLDGTAVGMASKGEDITDATCEAVARAYKSGKHVACATGRQWWLARSVVQRLGLKDPCIISGGTMIIDPMTEKILWEKTLGDSSVDFIFDIFQKMGQHARFASSVVDEVVQMNTVTTAPKGAHAMYLLGIDRDLAIEVANTINTHKNITAHVTPSWFGTDNMDVHATHRLATKEHAILEWHKITGISKAETIGMGDGANDLPIFESVGLKVAVTDATPELLALADYIAPSPQDGGLAHVIEKFLLSKD